MNKIKIDQRCRMLSFDIKNVYTSSIINQYYSQYNNALYI